MNMSLYQITPEQMRSLISAKVLPKLSDNEVETLVQAGVDSRTLIAGLYGEELVGFIGMVPITIASDSAYMWLYVNPPALRYRTMLARHSRLIITQLNSAYPRITGFCTTRQSFMWLQWLGAEFRQTAGNLMEFEIRRPA